MKYTYDGFDAVTIDGEILYDGLDDRSGEIIAESLNEIDELIAENAKLRAELAEAKRIIKYIDKKFPRADETCDEPGITLSEAVRRTLAEQETTQ